MSGKKVVVDYGETGVEIEVPESAFVAIRKDPPAIADPVEAFRKAICNPVGMPPIQELVRPGGEVTIAFDAPPRSGVPRRIAIPIILEELEKAGVPERHVRLICATGTQRKRTYEELRRNLGSEIFDRFWPRRLSNHDCTTNLVQLGESRHGDYVEYNSAVCESDLLFYLGTVVPLNWGGFTGVGAVIGLGSARSIESHHTDVINHPDSYAADPMSSLYMKHKLAIQAQIEKASGKKIFYADAAVNSKGEPAAVYAGHSPEIQQDEWKSGIDLFKVTVPQGDILVLGLPINDVYGTSHNPLVSLTYAAMAARSWLNKPLVRKGGVVIVLVRCDGRIDERTRPSDREVIDLFARCFSAADLRDYREEFLTRDDLIYRYRHCNACHPIHPFWLFYEDQYLLDHPGKVIFAGDVNPGAVRSVGCTPARSFEEALTMARHVVGNDARVLVVPRYFTRDRALFHVE